MPLAALTSAEILHCRVGRMHCESANESRRSPIPLTWSVLPTTMPANRGMSPLAAVALAREQGVATVVHVSCRDRNRMALQSQVVGAAALGSEGVLCLYGDPVEGVPRVKDLTATSLIAKAKEWAQPHELAVGAVVNPFAPDLHRELRLLEKKLTAGVDFLQSQMVFDLHALQRFFARRLGSPLRGCGSTPASAYCEPHAWLTTCERCPDV